MRLGLLVIVGLLPATAVAQTPPQWTTPQYLGPLQLEELRNNGLVDDDPSDDLPPSEECVQALKEIDRERAASDWALRRGEIEPVELKQSYEQDMYYADKRIKVIDRICYADGKRRSHDFGRWNAVQVLSSNATGCAIVARDCKPRKHW